VSDFINIVTILISVWVIVSCCFLYVRIDKGITEARHELDEAKRKRERQEQWRRGRV